MNSKNVTGNRISGRINAGRPRKKRKLNAKGKLVLFSFGTFITLAAVAAGGCFYMGGRKDHVELKKEVILEAGSRIRIEDFFSTCPDDAKFITNVSDIDTDVPAVYLLKVFYEKKYTDDVTLKIEDHTGPKGNAVAQEVYTTWKMPEAAECVDDLYDLSGIAKVEYQDGTPKFTEGGMFKIPVVVTDMYGNDTKIKVPFTVIDDRTAPVIEGVHDIYIEDNAGRLNLLEGVFTYDDTDPEPIVSVNDSAVRYNKSGEYNITYSAIDKAGNLSSVNARLTIKLPAADKKSGSDSNSQDNSLGGSGYSDSSDSDSYEDPVYDIAADIMSTLWRSNDVETARAIFSWVHSHITYLTVSDYMSYEDAAYRGFTRRSGDCYVYFSCAKMLLDCAGIPNLMVERYPVYTNGHYWNLVQLNGEWYHCDATVFRDHPDMYFMCTDKEIADSHHSFDSSLYPERAGGSTDYKATPTPEPAETPAPTPVPTETPEPTPVPTQPETPVPTPNIEPVEPEDPIEITIPSEAPEGTDEPVVITEPEDPLTAITVPDYTNLYPQA